MAVNSKMERMWNEVVEAQCKVLSLYPYGETEQNYEDLWHVHCLGQDENYILYQDKSEVLYKVVQIWLGLICV
jgi:hypothetical protein